MIYEEDARKTDCYQQSAEADANVNIFSCEKRLPLKKRKVSLLIEHEVNFKKYKTADTDDDISYPATRMICIADLPAIDNSNSCRTIKFKTPAEKKEVPPVAVCIPFVQLIRLPEEFSRTPTTIS